jgi:hypothetical protein
VHEPTAQADESNLEPSASIIELPDVTMALGHLLEDGSLFLINPAQQKAELARCAGPLTTADRLYVTFLEESEKDQGYLLGAYGPLPHSTHYAGAPDPTSIQGW